MDIEQERVKFESAVKTKRQRWSDSWFAQNEYRYFDSDVELLWQVWQAAVESCEAQRQADQATIDYLHERLEELKGRNTELLEQVKDIEDRSIEQSEQMDRYL